VAILHQLDESVVAAFRRLLIYLLPLMFQHPRQLHPATGVLTTVPLRTAAVTTRTAVNSQLVMLTPMLAVMLMR
jgi:hypothetical protein